MSLSSLDQTTPSGGYLETLEESKNPRARTLETGRYPKLCCNHRLCPKRPLADEQSQMGKYRLARCLLFITVSFVPLDLNLPGISRIAQYGPVCCVVWEGRPVRGVPIPIDKWPTYNHISLQCKLSDICTAKKLIRPMKTNSYQCKYTPKAFHSPSSKRNIWIRVALYLSLIFFRFWTISS